MNQYHKERVNPFFLFATHLSLFSTNTFHLTHPIAKCGIFIYAREINLLIWSGAGAYPTGFAGQDLILQQGLFGSRLFEKDYQVSCACVIFGLYQVFPRNLSGAFLPAGC
jgi:hypothetical protein